MKTNYPGVWYYRKVDPTDEESLRISVRSAVKNLGVSKVIIIGDKPNWFLEGKNAIWIPNYIPRSESWSIGWVPFQQMQALLSMEWDFDDFLLFNDDFFVLNKVEEWVDYCRSKASYESRTMRCKPYHLLTLATWKLVDSRVYFNLHIPMRLKISRLKVELILWRNLRNPNVDFRTLYGNLFLFDYPNLQTMDDVKIFQDDFDETQTFLSTWSDAFRIHGKVEAKLKEMFPDPCFCEIQKIQKIE